MKNGELNVRKDEELLQCSSEDQKWSVDSLIYTLGWGHTTAVHLAVKCVQTTLRNRKEAE